MRAHTHTHTHTHTQAYVHILMFFLSSLVGVVKAARDNANLVEAIGQEFHAEVRRRLEQDSDYSPERFPNAQKFYQPNK